MKNTIAASTGWAALLALLRERSPLGPLKVMAERVGRFFQIPLPGFRPYVVIGPDSNRRVLVTERHKVLWRNADPVVDLLGRGVLVVDGGEHARYRELMEPPLHPSALSGYTEKMTFHADRVSALWRDGDVVDMLVESRKIALLIVVDALFGRDAWGDLHRIWKPILKAIEYISPGGWIVWRRIPRFGFRKPLRELDQYLFEIIDERRNRMEAWKMESGKFDLLQHLIEAGLTDKLIRDQMLTMLIAGHDTSTALLAWVFVMLGRHPKVYKKLVEEVDSLEKPPLLDQVIKETLRLVPPIHTGNRSVAEEIQFPEGTVPAGERLFYSIYLTHRDERIWENADSFYPARFAHGRKTPPFSYIPFGGGPRACIGAAFGQAEARIVLAYLLKRFSFDFTGHSIHPHMGATLEPRPGVRMKVKRRHANR